MTDTAAAVEHTPGPWVAVNQTDLWGESDDREYREDCAECRADDCMGHITQRYWWIEGPAWVDTGLDSVVLNESDAHLIAAAPSMLAALEAIADEWYGLWVGSHSKFTPAEVAYARKVEDAVRAAIAQARGEKVQGG